MMVVVVTVLEPWTKMTGPITRQKRFDGARRVRIMQVCGAIEALSVDDWHFCYSIAIILASWWSPKCALYSCEHSAVLIIESEYCFERY